MEIFERSLQPAERPSKINSRVPPMLEEICVRCLEKEPEGRYKSAGELRLALEEYLHSTGRPMGAPQLSQFMKILFPTNSDPVRQRIESLVAEGNARDADEGLLLENDETAQALPRGGVVNTRRSDTQVSSEPSYEEDPEATAVVPPEERPDHQPAARTPSAVQLASDEANTVRGAAYKKSSPPADAPRPSGFRLRSVELASQLDTVRASAVAPPEEAEATLTRPPAFESEVSEPALSPPRSERTVELDPELLRDLRAGASEPAGPPLFSAEDEELDDLEMDLDDEVEVTDPGRRAETALAAPPPPLDPDAFDSAVEMPPYAEDSLADEEPARPMPASAEDIGLELAPHSAEGEPTDPDSLRFSGQAEAVSPSSSDVMDFDDVRPAQERRVIVQKAPMAARMFMLVLGLVVGGVLVGGGLFAFGELEWMAQRLSATAPEATAPEPPPEG